MNWEDICYQLSVVYKCCHIPSEVPGSSSSDGLVVAFPVGPVSEGRTAVGDGASLSRSAGGRRGGARRRASPSVVAFFDTGPLPAE